jgi:hypothetical protein
VDGADGVVEGRLFGRRVVVHYHRFSFQSVPKRELIQYAKMRRESIKKIPAIVVIARSYNEGYVWGVHSV